MIARHGGSRTAARDRSARCRRLAGAHVIVQEDGSALAAWLHGIVHTLEGDLDNALYWYRRAERTFRGKEAVQEEIEAARRQAFDARPEEASRR
jgi:hypothetical protein